MTPFTFLHPLSPKAYAFALVVVSTGLDRGPVIR